MMKWWWYIYRYNSNTYYKLYKAINVHKLSLKKKKEQTTAIHMNFGGLMGHIYQHWPLLLQGYEPRHGPLGHFWQGFLLDLKWHCRLLTSVCFLPPSHLQIHHIS
jgi:hypothetical protein